MSGLENRRDGSKHLASHFLRAQPSARLCAGFATELLFLRIHFVFQVYNLRLTESWLLTNPDTFASSAACELGVGARLAKAMWRAWEALSENMFHNQLNSCPKRFMWGQDETCFECNCQLEIECSAASVSTHRMTVICKYP